MGLSFFSINFRFLPLGTALGHDLYINATGNDKGERFVRIFPRGEALSGDFLDQLVMKYIQLYVPETQRDAYYQGLANHPDYPTSEKAEILKNAAIGHLEGLFGKEEVTAEELGEAVSACKDTVEGMIDVMGEQSVAQLKGLIGELSFHDFYTFDHSINVSMYCINIYRNFFPDCDRQDLVNIGLGGLLHDIGKLKIPTEVLNQADKLTDEQYKLIQTHPEQGLRLIQTTEHPSLEAVDIDAVIRIVHEHHENVDGTGYPHKKSSSEIHLMAKICAIADFFDAITTKRAYSQVLPLADALGVMEKTKGKKLDIDLFDQFKKMMIEGRDGEITPLRLLESFDPTLQYKQLPLSKDQDFGKIKFVDQDEKKSKRSKRKAS